MKKFVVLFSLGLLAGCAASGGGELGPTVLETPTYLRAERWVPKSFVQIQRGVFKHQAACHSNIRFAVDELHPSYARIYMPLDSAPGQSSTGMNRTMVLGLQLIEGKAARGRLYSYYTPTDTQIQEAYDIVLNPGLCPGDPRPAEPAKEKKAE